jgi:hypothetical protein
LPPKGDRTRRPAGAGCRRHLAVRQLIETVRTIFRRYLDLGSMGALRAAKTSRRLCQYRQGAPERIRFQPERRRQTGLRYRAEALQPAAQDFDQRLLLRPDGLR